MLNAVLAVNAADPPDWLQEISARDNVSYVVWTQDPWAPIFRDGEPMPNNPEQIKYTIKLQGCTNQYMMALRKVPLNYLTILVKGVYPSNTEYIR